MQNIKLLKTYISLPNKNYWKIKIFTNTIIFWTLFLMVLEFSKQRLLHCLLKRPNASIKGLGIQRFFMINTSTFIRSFVGKRFTHETIFFWISISQVTFRQKNNLPMFFYTWESGFEICYPCYFALLFFRISC